VLTTERLELCQPAPNDLPDLYELTAHADTRRFLGGFEPSESDSFARLLRNAGSWALWGYGTFMVRLKGDARIVANCGVFRSHRGFGADHGMDNVPEAGWIVHADHWGQGIAGDAMRAALAWFDATHGPQPIVCMIEQGHTVSELLAERLGFSAFGQHEAPNYADAPLALYRRSG
jgi:RimJ/RimL family protein N-acetyltransferase